METLASHKCRRAPISPVTRAKCVETIKLLNLAQLKKIVLRTDLTREWLDLELCSWYTEISSMVFRSAPCLQYVDVTLLRCKKSFAVMETLANNTSSLEHVTVRNPKLWGFMWAVLDLVSFQSFFPYSLLQLLGSLLEKSNISSLYLLDFDITEYEKSHWENPLADPLEDPLENPLENFSKKPSALKSGCILI